MGLEAVIAPPPLGAIFSLLLVAGCDAGGLMLARGAFQFARAGDPPWQRWQAVLIGAAALSALLFPLALLGLTPLWALQGTAGALVLLGAAHLWRGCRRLEWKGAVVASFRAERSSFERIALALGCAILLALGLIALAPVTNADALDYHIGVALLVLKEGGMPVRPEWFHGRLAGGGEVLNALGLALGADAFGALLQYAGLIAVIAVLIGVSRRSGDPETSNERGLLLGLAAASAPVLLFLVSGPKPQLLYQGMTTLALALIFAPSGRSTEEAPTARDFALICLLTMTATAAKLSFLLTGGLVGTTAFGWMVRRGRVSSSVTIAAVGAALIVAPTLLWKMAHFGSGPVEALVSPLPGTWPGNASFADMLRTSRESALPFPVSLLLPDSFGTLSTVIGAGLLLVLWIRPVGDRRTWGVLTLAGIGVILGSWLGQRTTRFFVDEYFWMLLACSIAPAECFRVGPARWLVTAQAAGMAALCWFGAVTLFPGALTREWRTEVMRRAADGYTVMEWADRTLPEDAVLLSGHRSLALAPRQPVSTDWMSYVGDDPESWRPYLNLLRMRGITHMLLLGPVDSTTTFYECLGPRVAGPTTFRTATRNPFNAGSAFQASLFEFESDRLPDCAIRTKP